MRVFIGRGFLDIDVKRVSFFGRFFGLMFLSVNCDNLLFEFGREGKWSIHSYFVFFDFLAIWIDDDKRVIEAKVVKPFTFSVKPKKKFKYLVEIPLNSKNKKIVEFFRRKRKI